MCVNCFRFLVTEIEIAEGIFKSETDSIWISREMKDLLENLDTPKANRYTGDHSNTL